MDSAVPSDSNASVDRQLVAWIETVSVRGVAGWMAKHAQALGVLAVAAGYGLAIVYLTLGLGAVGLSPLDSGYSLADVTPYALVIALYFFAAAAILVSCVAALWMLGHRIGLVARESDSSMVRVHCRSRYGVCLGVVDHLEFVDRSRKWSTTSLLDRDLDLGGSSIS